MIERRKHHRGRVLFGAALDFNRHQSVLDCVIKNLSEGGAKIACAGGAPIPGRVRLTIRHRGETFFAQTVWQRHGEAGLVFEHDERSAAVIDFAARRRRTKRRIDGFLSDETAGGGLDSVLVLILGGGVAAAIAYAANHAIETQFNALLLMLRAHLG